MVNTNCDTCPFSEKCYMKDNPKRIQQKQEEK